MEQNQQEVVNSATPEPYIIGSQYRLQQVVEMDNPQEVVPQHVLDEYMSRGHMILTNAGKAILAAPIKRRQ